VKRTLLFKLILWSFFFELLSGSSPISWASGQRPSRLKEPFSKGELETPSLPPGSEWLYLGYIYQNKVFPPLDPELKMRFFFESGGRVRLIWENSGGLVRCERLAEYKIINNIYLWQKNIWVNPQNHTQCASDKDMALGYESTSVFKILPAKEVHPDLGSKATLFQLSLTLGEENVDLFFELQNSPR
jgi:hypothetical protein